MNMKQENIRAELRHAPELTTHLKKQDKRKNVCTQNEPMKSPFNANGGNGCKRNDKGAQENVEKVRIDDKNGTFWTVCPYCYYMYEYGKAFEECSLRCQNCQRAFHGVPVVEPNNDMLVPGKDEYYCGLGYFSLKYSLSGGGEKKESGGEGKRYNVGEVVEISDDSDGDGCEGVNANNDERVKEDVSNGNMMQGSGKADVRNERKKMVARKNVKSVPWNSKKKFGRGLKRKKMDGELGVGGSGGSGSVGVGCETNVEFIETDDDVFVGSKPAF